MNLSSPSSMPILPRKRPSPDPEFEANIGITKHSFGGATLNVHCDSLGSSALPSLDGPSTGPDSAGAPSTKRQKTGPSDKEDKRKEREEAEGRRLEQKARREMEKQQKELERESDRRRKEEERTRREEERRKKLEGREDERKKKDEERERRKRLRELEQKTKDQEKRKKEEEGAKKDQSQLRLNAFFIQPKTSPEKSLLRSIAESEHKIAGVGDVLGTRQNTGSPAPSLPRHQQTDYERVFAPFFVQSHVVMANYTRHGDDTTSWERRMCEIDRSMKGRDVISDRAEESRRGSKRLGFSKPSHRGSSNRSLPRYSVRELMAQMQGSADFPVDLTNRDVSRCNPQPGEVIAKFPVKILQFAEDVRPPYRGTYTKLPPANSALRLGRNPFERSLPETDYDYDSEAEWEEPEEGEDLDSEGEEEVASDEEGDEMAGFLDDEDVVDGPGSAGSRRRLAGGILDPVSTGLCFESSEGRTNAPGAAGSASELQNFRMEVISNEIHLPIDPQSSAYWHAQPPKCIVVDTDTMRPPRIPLNAVNRAGGVTNQLLTKRVTLTKSMASLKPPMKGSQGSRRLVDPEDMDEFRSAVKGSDLTKTGLIEVLKKRFPKMSKDVIRDTLGVIATRVGTKEADKRWALVDCSLMTDQ